MLLSVVRDNQHGSNMGQPQPFGNYSVIRIFDSVKTNIPVVLKFLHTLKIEGMNYCSINTAKAALNTCIILKDGKQLGMDSDVQQFV